MSKIILRQWFFRLSCFLCDGFNSSQLKQMWIGRRLLFYFAEKIDVFGSDLEKHKHKVKKLKLDLLQEQIWGVTWACCSWLLFSSTINWNLFYSKLWMKYVLFKGLIFFLLSNNIRKTPRDIKIAETCGGGSSLEFSYTFFTSLSWTLLSQFHFISLHPCHFLLLP